MNACRRAVGGVGAAFVIPFVIPEAGTSPAFSAAPLPDPAELASVIGTLTDELKAAYARLESTGGETVPRRLNRFELMLASPRFYYLNGRGRDIIDSDCTFLNERVAQWIYQRDDVWGDGVRRVAARPPHGGGMLTMPAIMTATANGVDTSPVVRGVWLLKSILGTPPAPPPPDVEPLSPDLRGAKSIRDQLAAHRAQESRAACHRRIDPFGFPFENFDELGLWRTRCRDGGGSGGGEKLSIDASAELPDGTKVDDVAADGNRLRDLIQRVVASRIFREKYAVN